MAVHARVYPIKTPSLVMDDGLPNLYAETSLQLVVRPL
jgi:hypothetical protein